MSVIALVHPLALDRNYLFGPATGYWRRPNGSHGGGGAGKLIEEVRRASSSQGQPRQMRCFSATALQSGNLFPGYNALPDPIGRPPVAMARRSTPTTRKRIGATSAARAPTERSSIVHSSLYLPEPVYEVLRKIAFDERAKIHDIVLEGIDAALRRRGYPSVEGLKAGKRR
jgi:hypothetical protein